jgi:hypothetical protein
MGAISSGNPPGNSKQRRKARRQASAAPKDKQLSPKPGLAHSSSSVPEPPIDNKPQRKVYEGVGLVLTALGVVLALDHFWLQLAFAIVTAIILVDWVGQWVSRGSRSVLVSRITLAIVLIAVGIPLEYRQYKIYLASQTSGELEPLGLASANFPTIQVGNSRGSFRWKPSENSKSGDGSVWIGFQDAGLIVERINGKLFLTGDIRGEDGNMVVKINKNRWFVFSSEVMDKNYTTNALEVFDKRGVVVLQVVLDSQAIKIQGEFWSESGTGLRLVENPDDPAGYATMLMLHRGIAAAFPMVKATFGYPSKEHQGELFVRQR